MPTLGREALVTPYSRLTGASSFWNIENAIGLARLRLALAIPIAGTSLEALVASSQHGDRGFSFVEQTHSVARTADAPALMIEGFESFLDSRNPR